jgi:uncharacterized membrane protein (UPF0127 family)
MRLGVLTLEGAVLAERVEVTETPLERMRGLLGRRSLAPRHAMWFDGCSLLHTCFMRFAIDVLFLDRSGRIVAIRRAVPPFRLVWGGWHAHVAVEAAAGAFSSEPLQPGRRVALA